MGRVIQVSNSFFEYFREKIQEQTHSVNGVELSGDELGEPSVAVVVNAAAALDNVYVAFEEARGHPLEVVGLWVVVRVKDRNDVGTRVGDIRQKVVDVVGLALSD